MLLDFRIFHVEKTVSLWYINVKPKRLGIAIVNPNKLIMSQEKSKTALLVD